MAGREGGSVGGVVEGLVDFGKNIYMYNVYSGNAYR